MKIYLKTKGKSASDYQEFNREVDLYKYIFFNWVFYNDFNITIVDEKEFDLEDIFNNNNGRDLF